MNEDKIYLSPPHLTGEEIEKVTQAFQSNWIAPLGPFVDEFERDIIEYTGAKHALAVSSGTAGIHLALRVMGVEEGDIVLCSSLTFIASANPIIYEKAIPVFIDSEPNTWNMSPEALERALIHFSRKNMKPKAIIIVNLYGQSARMDRITELCNKYEVPIIEDAAESLGAKYNSKSSGTFGKIGVYSFNGNKIITTSGGGMMVSSDENLLLKAKFLATQAREPVSHYEHRVTGYNYRLSNILAAIGVSQLNKLNERIEYRRRINRRYKEELEIIPDIYWLPEEVNSFETKWLSVLLVESKEQKEKLINFLFYHNIEARSVWKPMHLQPLFKENEYFLHAQDKDVSQEHFNKGVCLPSGSSLTIAQQERIIKKIKQFYL